MTEDQSGAPGSALTSYLTPMAAAISGFTLAVFSLFGNGAWVFPVQVFATSDSFPGDFDNVVIAYGVIQALLAGAAGLVAAVGLVVAVATIIAGVVN